MLALPHTRAEAKAQGSNKYFTGKSCKHGHVTERLTESGCCIACSLERGKQWRRNNKDRVQKRDAMYYQKYKSRKIEYANEYRSKFPEKTALVCRNWRAKNKHKHAHSERKRQAAKMSATPKWLSKSDYVWMDKIYYQARLTSDKYSADINVDHIIPLQGKDVCGLHVPWNLRLVSRSYNSTKNNNPDDVPFLPSYCNIIVHSSALPWNLKETSNGD